MHIEIKDLQSGQTFRIDEKGTTIGRDKNRATIAVGESGVSGLHARIATKDNKWWLEDLGSSNGTFIDTDRLAKGAPAQLERGTTFKFHTYKFEVIDIDPDGGGGKTQVFSGDTNVAIKPPSEPVDQHPRTQENVVVQQDPPEDEQEASAPVSAPVKTDNPKVAATKTAPKKVSAAAVMNAGHKSGGGGGGGASAAPAGSFGAEFGKAIAFYLAAIPKLLFMFKGQVEESIANQKYPPMKGMPLAAWALPPNLLGAIIGAVSGLVVMIVSGQLAIVSWVISLVIGVAIAVVASIIAGFIFHPLTAFILKLLKASPEKNTEAARSNWFVIVMTATGLTQIITGVGVLFGLLAIIPVVGPFTGIIPVLLGVVGGLIGLYVAYRGLQWFEVMKWVPYVFLALMALSLVSGVLGMVGVIRVAVAGVGSGSSSGGVATIDLGGNGGGNAEAQKAIEEAKAAAEKAIAEAKAAQGKAGKGAKETKEDAKTAKEDAKTAAAEAKIAAAEAKAAKAGGTAGGKDDYEAYLRKREAVEQAIEKNPTVLTGIAGVLPLYKQLHKDTKLINEKYKKQKGDNVAERIKDAELYDRTVDTVAELHRKILER